MAELNTLSPKKWLGDYGGNAPTLDVTDGVSVGDAAIETGATSTDRIWRCIDNTDTAPYWQMEFNHANTVVVDKDGAGQYLTVEEGITAASAKLPTANNPILIKINPGVYTEAPLTVPSYVSIVGQPNTVYIRPDAATQTTFTFNANSAMSFVDVQNCSGTGGVAIKTTVGAGAIVIRSCNVYNCETGFWSTGASSSMSLYLCTAIRTPGTTLTNAYQATVGGNMNAIGCIALGTVASIITNGWYATGTNSFLVTDSSSTTYCTNAIYADDAAIIDANGVIIKSCTNALRLGSTSTPELNAYSVDITESTSLDIYIETSSGHLDFIGGRFNISLIDIADGAGVNLNAFSTFENDEGMVTWGQQEVGRIGAGNELCVGEGDSTIVGMAVQTNTNGEAGSWVDETANAGSPTGSTFTFFPGVTAENCIYVGGDFTFVGLKTSGITTVMTLGAGAVAAEYWNGSTWVEFDIMECEADSPYTQRGNAVLQNTGSVQLRFGDMTSWATKSLNGVTKYWARYRITTAITTSPVAQQFKLSTNRTELNQDGFMEFFGAARPVRNIPTDYSLVDLEGFLAANADVDFGTNTDISALNNARAGNAKDGSGGVFRVPQGLDTSKPVTMTISWIVEGAGSGDVELEGALALAQAGDTLDGTLTEITDAAIVTISAANDAGVLIKTDLTFNIPAALEGESVAFSTWRDALGGNADDTLTNTVAVVNVTLSGYFWR